FLSPPNINPPRSGDHVRTTQGEHTRVSRPRICDTQGIMAGMDIRRSVQRKLLLASYFTGPIAILLVPLLGFFMVSTRPPTPVETYTALTQYNRAEYFARQYLLIWLAGSDRLSDQLSEMTSVGERKIELNPDPLKVTDINVVSVKRWITD